MLATVSRDRFKAVSLRAGSQYECESNVENECEGKGFGLCGEHVVCRGGWLRDKESGGTRPGGSFKRSRV
jgi:hypothetical protein